MCTCVYEGGWGTDLFRQLTLMETQMLVAVTPADMYYKTSKDGGKGGRRLMDLIDHFNRVRTHPSIRAPRLATPDADSVPL